MPVVVLADDGQWVVEMEKAGTKLVVVDFTASWCGPCKSIAPFFEGLSNRYPNAVFLKVDVDECQATAAAQGVSAMPTFIFFRNKTRIDKMQGADQSALEAKVKQHYGDGNVETDAGVKGFMEMSSFIDKSKCECLNEADDHPYTHALTPGEDGYLESDCDEQLILSLSFNQNVKIHSLKIKAPKDKGPKTIRIFQNQPATLDFDKADSMIAVQDLALSPEQLDGSPISLRFVKFQNVQNIQFFIKDNQEGEEVTQIHYFGLVGTPVNTTNMNEFKRVAGKKGEVGY